MNDSHYTVPDDWQPISRAEQKKLYHCTHPDNSSNNHDVLLEGSKMLEEALRQPQSVRAVYSREPLADLSLPRHTKTYLVTDRDARQFSSLDRFPGVACRVNIEYTSTLEADECAVCLYRLQDPGNAGTIIRTAEWYGVKTVLLNDSVSVYNTKLLQATMGSVLRVKVVRNASLTELSATHSIYISDMEGAPVESIRPQRPWIICIGNESRGSGDLVVLNAERITIPRLNPNINSLNAAVSCGIILDRFRTAGG